MGIKCNLRSISRKTPISSIFKMVPIPIFSPNNTAIITTINPIIIDAFPILIPTVFATPTWKTSQGAYPI